jgi:hypothetical protein
LEFSTRPPHAALPIRFKRPTNIRDGKGFIVTGGAGDIGRATAELPIAEGARVVHAHTGRAFGSARSSSTRETMAEPSTGS